jgi:uncharacterized protein YggE
MTDPQISNSLEHTTMDSMTEIAVDGKATVVTVPDTISLLIRVNVRATEYADALHKLGTGCSDVTSVLAGCAISKAPQTREYSVQEDWDNKYDAAKRKLIGYEGVQQLVVDFPMDMQKLGKALHGLGAIDCHPSVDTYFEVADQTAMFAQARKNALTAATATAEDMAAQMGLKIVGVKSMKHSMTREGSPHSLHVGFDDNCLAHASFVMPEIVPEEVSNTANVSVAWVAVSTYKI